MIVGGLIFNTTPVVYLYFDRYANGGKSGEPSGRSVSARCWLARCRLIKHNRVRISRIYIVRGSDGWFLSSIARSHDRGVEGKLECKELWP
jgi:hypothetical protein